MMTPDEIYTEFTKAFKKRQFVAGLLVSFVDLFIDLGTYKLSLADFQDFTKEYPRKETTKQGKTANTLIVEMKSGSTTSLRPYYNKVERFFRAEKKRYDYPSCAPHATQAWADYQNWLDSLCTFPKKDLQQLRERVVAFVLSELKDQSFDPNSVYTDPPLFKMIIQDFDLSVRKGEKSGAAYQGVIFGFIRADNPHLQVEIDKVRTGSKRLQRVGDIDAWEADRLAITAEVKQYSITSDMTDSFKAFAHSASERGSVGIVAALEFDDEARTQITALGVTVLSRSDLLRSVTIWDPVKQRTAVSSFLFYVKQIEKNSALADRLDAFLATMKADWDAQSSPQPDSVVSEGGE